MNTEDPITRVPAPVLTRWWYVGVAAEFFVDHYLSIYRATQLIVNDHDLSSRPNEIASHLYSLMLEPKIYSDLIFPRSFRVEFLVEHFDWFQEADEITKEPGFRSRQIAVRYFFMMEDIKKFEQDLKCDGRLLDWKGTLLHLNESERKEQWDTAELFMKEAKKSLLTHFDRWMNTLLPFALGSDAINSKGHCRSCLGTWREDDTS